MTAPARARRRAVALGVAAVAVALSPAAARASPSVRPWPAERSLPRFELSDLAGTAWRLGALRGHVVLLNFWATWCAPCRAEMPSLEAFAKRHRHDGVLVLTVNYREDPSTIRRFLERMPLSLPVLLDRDGDAAAAWTPRVFPSSVLIDRSGAPASTVIGEMDWASRAAEALVAPLIAAGHTDRHAPR